MKITVEMLRKHGACPVQIDIFAKEWPDGWKTVTRKRCRRAAEFGLDFDWAAEKFFSARARRAYEKARAASRKVYNKFLVTADQAHNKASSRARKAYQKTKAVAFFRASRIESKAERTSGGNE